MPWRINQTWSVFPLPPNKKSIGCCWIFGNKFNVDGTIARHKARLVAKRYNQQEGIDFIDTFSLVAKLVTMKMLLVLAASHKWHLAQLDIKNAFLNGDLFEEVYMDLPPGLEFPSASGKVCKLKKALYELKQSPRAWFERLSRAMQKFGYKQSQADHTLFIKLTRERSYCVCR